jgi:two-component system sensor histidine kinase DegS
LDRDNLEMLADELAQLEERIQTASNQVREVISDMRRPQIDADSDLDDYIQRAIDTHLERGGPPVDCECDFSSFPSCSVQQKLALYRILQEALLNIRKHANAQNVYISILNNDKDYSLIIADDGQGFNLAEVKARPIDKGGAGFANLEVRAQAVGGAVTVGSNPSGKGTEIKITFLKS